MEKGPRVQNGVWAVGDLCDIEEPGLRYLRRKTSAPMSERLKTEINDIQRRFDRYFDDYRANLARRPRLARIRSRRWKEANATIRGMPIEKQAEYADQVTQWVCRDMEGGGLRLLSAFAMYLGPWVQNATGGEGVEPGALPMPPGNYAMWSGPKPDGEDYMNVSTIGNFALALLTLEKCKVDMRPVREWFERACRERIL